MQAADSSPVLCLMGPTASGKTELAIWLADRLPVEIVSVDSAMVYRGLDIGTAKPAAEVLRRYPHRLINLCDPSEPYSAGRFVQDARREITAIAAAGRIPLLVGGTGLYFRALFRGLAPLPAASPELRRKLADEAARIGWPDLHRRLRQLDPAAAARIQPGDSQRIQRALEVCMLTGRRISDLQCHGDAPVGPGLTGAVRIIIEPAARGELAQRIEQRFRGMLERGLLDEIGGLYRRGDLGPHLPAMRLVGYRQGWRYLAGDLGYEEMVERAVIATRQLAKRQRTWLRSEQDARHFDSEAADLGGKILKFLREEPNISKRV
jgi:tRNA dimethylallyltransferase